MKKILGTCVDHPTEDVDDVINRVRRLERAGYPVHIYPDADEFIEQRLLEKCLRQTAEEICVGRRQPRRVRRQPSRWFRGRR